MNAAELLTKSVQSLFGVKKIHSGGEAPSLRMGGDGMGWGGMGWDGVSKVSFNFLHTLWVYRSCICILIYIVKSCHQHSYGFENSMSSWGVRILSSKLVYVGVFLKKHAKSIEFQVVILNQNLKFSHFR